jgi:hypothetical protein
MSLHRDESMKRLPQLRNRGSAMALAVVAMMILFAMGVGLLALASNTRIYSARMTSAVAARCAADAGVTKALFEMNQKLEVKPWNDSSLPEATDESLPGCSALYSYTITGDAVSGYTVESTGVSGELQKTVSCTLKPQGPFEFAVFANQSLELDNSAVVDGYNFGADDKILEVGTNSVDSDAILLNNSATIDGDVVVGVGADPSAVVSDHGATITGEARAMTEKNSLSAIEVPHWLESLPSNGILEDATTITSSAKYSGIDLKTNKTIVIDGNVSLYTTGDVILNNSAELQIKSDASLILYLGGNFEGKNSSSVNNLTKDAKKLQIYCLGSCQNVRLKNSVDFYGVIYGPDANVVLDNSANFYGAVVAQNFEQRNSGTFNYDASLRDAGVNDEAVRFVVTDWHEQ